MVQQALLSSGDAGPARRAAQAARFHLRALLAPVYESRLSVQESLKRRMA
ncbi:hypothetical protein RSWS8N_17934 [Cereibacter sphaeroides WS8N]|nr:hypothetical protein RSWS8N_17934 [Cereibacter sphaeroides WS8N]